MTNWTFIGNEGGSTMWMLIFNMSNQVWQTTTETFVTFVTANHADYAVTLTNLNSSYPIAAQGIRSDAFPSTIPAGTYWIVEYSSSSGVTLLSGSYTDQRISPYTAKGVMASIVSWNGTDFGSPFDDVYHAQINLQISATTNNYNIVWFKNGVVYTTAQTSPTVTVIDRSDGSTFLSTSLTQVSGAIYTHTESTTLINTASNYTYIINASGTTDTGVNISYSKIVGVKQGALTY